MKLHNTIKQTIQLQAVKSRVQKNENKMTFFIKKNEKDNLQVKNEKNEIFNDSKQQYILVLWFQLKKLTNHSTMWTYNGFYFQLSPTNFLQHR